MAKQIKFNSIQVSDFMTTMEKHGIEVYIDDDNKAGAMFSDLLIDMARSLTPEQVDIFHNEL